MLDTGAWRGDRAVTSLLRFKNTSGGMAASLNVHAPASLLQAHFPFDAEVTPVDIDIAAGIARVKQLFENVGIGHGSVGDDDLANQLATLVDTGMQLVATLNAAGMGRSSRSIARTISHSSHRSPERRALSGRPGLRICVYHTSSDFLLFAIRSALSSGAASFGERRC